MSCNDWYLRRGAVQGFAFTLRTPNGAERPVATGDVIVFSFGAQTSSGSSLLQKSSAVPGEVDIVIGSAVVTVNFTAADTDTTLTGMSYAGDVWIGGDADSPIAQYQSITLNIMGRVNPSPPGA